jgi:hypothetical protein
MTIMDEVKQEMKAQRHKELVQKFFTHRQMVHNTSFALAKEINESDDLAPILKEIFLTMLIEIMGLLRVGAQVLEMLNMVISSDVANGLHRENEPNAAWLDEQLGDSHNDDGD